MTRTDPSNTIFQKAVAFVNQTGRHLFLTGKAGTGKTTFLKYIKENSFKKMAVVAPTGVAAINAGGVTIHSFFQLPFGAFVPARSFGWDSMQTAINNKNTLLQNFRLRSERRDLLRELDLLIIDEVSMVRADMLDAIDTVLRHVRRQPLLPFGGVQMLYIGDLFQLPPVVKQDEWEILKQYYRSPFFFDAHALQHAQPLYLELKKIYRQKDPGFISILNNVRNNCCTQDDLELLNAHYKPGYSPAKEDNYITLTSHNGKADTINEAELAKLPGKLYSFEAAVTGEFDARIYPNEKALRIKEGAQIMFIKNDKGEARRYYNGKIGTITNLSTEKITVSFAGESDALELEQEKWQNIRYDYNLEKDTIEEKELGTFTQYPIRLAWAITIHKSQGLTFDKAIIDAGASFAAGQVYVALSRLTGLQGLVLHSRINPSSISTDSRALEFVQNELDEDVLGQKLEEEQKSFIRTMLAKGFGWENLLEAVTLHVAEYEHRQIPDKTKSIEWANDVMKEVTAQYEVSVKFRRQLEQLFVSCEQEGYGPLYSRTVAAAGHFTKAIDENLLSPLRLHLKVVKPKPKAKKYVNELSALLLLFERKKQQVNQALQLAEALHKSAGIDALMKMVEEQQKPIAVELPKEEMNVSKGKPAKGETGRLSLQMFKEGKSIADIAAARSLAASTIEGHLAAFVAIGEVDVLDLIDAEKLDKVISIMKENPESSHSELRKMMRDEVSFGQLRAVTGYLNNISDRASAQD
ncbi:MAG: helicase [Segetibacter sp.]|nr:helicase [Segetibacter sp.]